jgi:lysophospholipase L1-like esterase
MYGVILSALALILPGIGFPNSGTLGVIGVAPNPNPNPALIDPGIETFPYEGSAHVPVGTTVVYMTDPPTSGNHYPYPQGGGYFETPIESGFLLHSMEHGGVIIYYNPATVTDAQKYSLKTLARNHPGLFGMVVCVPRNDPAYPIILTAWTHRLRLETYDQSRFDGFVTLFLNQGPEYGPVTPPPVSPSPLISRGKPVFANDDNADAPALVDGIYGTRGPGASWRPAALPAWVSIQIGSGYSSLLLSWNTSGTAPSYTGIVGVPQAYTVDTSSDSTNGADGTWTTVVTVTDNAVRARAHRFDFSGKSWVRLTVSLAPLGVDIDEIDVHSLSPDSVDTIFFMGDSITAVSFDRLPARQPSYAEVVHGAHPAFFPAMIDGGIAGEVSSDGLSHINSWLALNPDFKFWALGYGTNDARRNVNPETFRANMQTLIDRVKAAGRVPIIARIPYSPVPEYATIPTYNQVINELVTANNLVPGPDLYAWFSSNPSELGPDGIHPTNDGAVSINRLWAQALNGFHTDPPTPPGPPPPPPPPPPASNGAQFVSQVVPTTMGTGGTYAVSVTMMNSGTSSWTAASSYSLGSRNPTNNTIWGMNRVALDAGDSVGPGQMKTFTWNVTAPSTPGTYDFQWRMVQDGVEQFGENSPNVVVTATQAPPPPPPASNGAQFVSQVVPTTMGTGGTHTVSVTLRNTGTTSWTAASSYALESQNPPSNTTWGMSRVALDAGDSVGPGQMKTFSWNVTAPSTPGTYDFQWRMIQDGVERFGDLTPDVAVTATQAAPPPPTPAPSPAPTKDGKSSHCGLLGLEVLAPLLLLNKLRRRTSKRSKSGK